MCGAGIRLVRLHLDAMDGVRAKKPGVSTVTRTGFRCAICGSWRRYSNLVGQIAKVVLRSPYGTLRAGLEWSGRARVVVKVNSELVAALSTSRVTVHIVGQRGRCYNRIVKVSTQRLPESQVALEIEVDAEQMERSLDRAYRKLVQRVEVPGFRKGKTPREMFERHIGRDRLVREALDILIPEAYNKAIDEQDIDAIDQPSIELLKDEPLAFKATVPVRPTVDLGDYKKVRIEREFVFVDEADVDQSIEELRHRYALHEPVERPVEAGDIVRADVQVMIDGREVYKDDDAEFRLRDGATILLPGFVEGLIGAEKGVTKDIPVKTPDGEQPLSDKAGTATVTVKEIKAERLPELNDDFAREVGEGFARPRRPPRAPDRRHPPAALRAGGGQLSRPRGRRARREGEGDRVPAGADRARDRAHHPRPGAFDRHGGREVPRDDQAHAGATPGGPHARGHRARAALSRAHAADRGRKHHGGAERGRGGDRATSSSSSGEQGEQLRRLFSTPDARSSIERSLLTRKTMDRLLEFADQDDGAKAKESGKKKSTKKPVAASQKKEA